MIKFLVFSLCEGRISTSFCATLMLGSENLRGSSTLCHRKFNVWEDIFRHVRERERQSRGEVNCTRRSRTSAGISFSMLTNHMISTMLLNIVTNATETSRSQRSSVKLDRSEKRQLAKKKRWDRIESLAATVENSKTKKNTHSQIVPEAEVIKNTAIKKRKKAPSTEETVDVASAASTQIISSLFTNNPEIPAQLMQSFSSKMELPSNSALKESFAALGVDEDLVKHLHDKMSILSPTEIQMRTIPLVLKPDSMENADLIVKAETGSGKTLAYCVPLMQRILEDFSPVNPNSKDLRQENGTLAIVIVPTRELTHQVQDTLRKLLLFSTRKYPHWLVSSSLSGGDKRQSEKARLRKGVTIVVATPGRLLDHLRNTEKFQVANLRWLVLDEADRLLELGFEESLNEIVKILKEKRKSNLRIWSTLLCSATLDENVDKLAKSSMKSPVVVTTKENKDTLFNTPKQLQQSYLIVPSKLRLVTLTALLKNLLKKQKTGNHMRIMVFFSCCDEVDFYHSLLTQGNNLDQSVSASCESISGKFSYTPKDVNIYRLHGSLDQHQRNNTLSEFSNTSKSASAVLFCTDIAARGLHIPDLAYIVQFDPPIDAKDYVHRVGRTARLGQYGNAMIFLLPSETEYLSVLHKNGVEQLEAVDFEEVLKESADGNKETWKDQITLWQNGFEKLLIKDIKV